MVGERMELTRETGYIRLISSSNMLSHYQTLESTGVHAASVKMVYPTTRKWFQYTFVGSVICQAMRCGCTMARKCLRDEDRMDEMLNAICPEFEAVFEDPPTPEVQKFLSSLKL
jgi:hypothetical protein